MSKVTPLNELGVERLQYVFRPSGLPLVEKEPGQLGTTSILIRGTAGAGKTTLAAALASAIARAQQGVTLYLTTEFSPAELEFKAELLGLEPNAVRAWGAGENAPGTLLVETLARLEQQRLEAGETDTLTRPLLAMGAIHELLHPKGGGTERPPVRVVVLDALALQDVNVDSSSLRESLLQMIQGLEHEGISTILVEEANEDSSSWVAFVVDVVFELSFGPEVETAELQRKLICSKCRYSLFVPGPHDCGVDTHSTPRARPVLWPSSMNDVVRAADHRFDAVRAAIPQGPGLWTFLDRGELVLSYFDLSDGTALRFVEAIPGVRLMHLDCGTTSVVDSKLEVSDAGAYALGWTCLQYAKSKNRNTILVQSLETLLQRSHRVVPLMRMIHAMTRAGMLVVVHGHSALLEPTLSPAADFVWGGHAKGRRRRSSAVRFTERWLFGQEVLGEISSETRFNLGWLLHDLPHCTSSEDLRGKEQLLTKDYADRRVDSGLGKSEMIFLGARAGVQVEKRHSPALHARVALLDGDEWAAGRLALGAFDSDPPDPRLLTVWKCICAAVGLNPAAIDELKNVVNEEPLVFGSLLRGLAQLNRFDEVDSVVNDLPRWHGDVNEWLLERLRAEARLEGDADAVKDGRDRLLKLLDGEELTYVHRAEVIHNVGVAEGKLGRRHEALSRHREALNLNPYLAVAREELERLRSGSSRDDETPL